MNHHKIKINIYTEHCPRCLIMLNNNSNRCHNCDWVENEEEPIYISYKSKRVMGIGDPRPYKETSQ